MPDDAGPTRRHGAPSEIGPYRILQTLGEGGMGVVYEAEQTAPVRRRVALKVVRTGYDTKEIVARFEAERQALAVMDHPNIARVYEAGTTGEGLPYFAMELVRGTPITEYCDTQTLSPAERLRLFVPVCRAVQHAHHKGVIHRDLKPSNVLVTIADSRPVPKVIDFGIAKAIGHDLTDKTLVTQLGQLMGTPEYMSPEQAEMTGLDIDTRTDIYSLGVILYELLVGARPLDLRNVALVALWKAIREQTPPTPSTRFSTLPGDTQQAIAHYRHTDAADLRRTLKGDLDWVVMKSLEKDRTRRYETANEVAVDLERFLRHEPVVARPPSAGYRLRKFVRRHRAGVAAAVIGILAVSAGSTAAVVGMVRAQRAEERAVAEANAAREVADFLEGLFESSDPAEARGDSITARAVLDRGADRIRTELQGQPLTQARLMDSIGWVYLTLGLFDEARPLLEQALALRESELGARHLEVASSLQALGDLDRRTGRYDAAESAFRRALTIREEALGPEHLEVSEIWNDLGLLHRLQNRLDDAALAIGSALRIAETNLPPDAPEIASRLTNLADLYADLARFEDAEPLYIRAIAINERRGPDHPQLAISMSNLGVLYWQQGRPDDAEPLFERALAIREKVLGREHPEVGDAYYLLGILHGQQGRTDQAKDDFVRALAIFEGALGPEHPDVAQTLHALSTISSEQGRQQEAEAFAVRALRLREAALGADHDFVASSLMRLADVYLATQRAAEARPLLTRALDIRERALGAEHPAVADVLDRVGRAERALGRTARADSLDARAREIRDAPAPEDDASPAN